MRAKRQAPAKASGDADARELVANAPRAPVASGTQGGETGTQFGAPGIDAQAHDMDGLAGEGDRDLDARHEGQAMGAGDKLRGRDAAKFVVIGQREQLDAVGDRAQHQRFGLEPAVRDGGMAVQVDVEGVQPRG